MFEIINNLAQELNNVEGHISMLSRPPTPYPFSNINNDVQFTHENTQQNDEPDEGSEEYSNDSDENEEDDERIIVSDDEDEDDDISVEELSDDEDEKEEELVIEDISESKMEEEESKSLETPNFAKMNLGSLKAYIVEKGLVEDASKMKKENTAPNSRTTTCHLIFIQKTICIRNI